MKIEETRINQAGLMRCCIQTLCELDPQKSYSEGQVVQCAYDQHLLDEAPHQMILLCGVWRWHKCKDGEHIWFNRNGRAICSVCNIAGEWFCEKSPSQQCQPSVDSAPAFEMNRCVFCGKHHEYF